MLKIIVSLLSTFQCFWTLKCFLSLRIPTKNVCIHSSFPTPKHVPPFLFHQISVLWPNSSPLYWSDFFHVEQRYLSRGWWPSSNLQQLLIMLRSHPIQTEKHLLQATMKNEATCSPKTLVHRHTTSHPKNIAVLTFTTMGTSTFI